MRKPRAKEPMRTNICAVCGKKLGEGYIFCSKCESCICFICVLEHTKDIHKGHVTSVIFKCPRCGIRFK